MQTHPQGSLFSNGLTQSYTRTRGVLSPGVAWGLLFLLLSQFTVLAEAVADVGAKNLSASITYVSQPAAVQSFGDAGVYVKIKPRKKGKTKVRIKLGKKVPFLLQAESLRLAKWDAKKKRYAVIANSRYDANTNTVFATVGAPGTYGVFGLSRLSHVYEFQRQACGTSGFPRVGIEQFELDRLCLVILCAPFDATAWSAQMENHMGMRIPPGDFRAGYGNLCERCTGARLAPGRLPECGIREPVPGGGGGTIPPPRLEQLPNTIANGGRAVSAAASPSTDNQLVVASETGGMFKSSDAGVNWTHVSGSTLYDFSDVHYDLENPTIVVATARRDTRVVSRGGMWRSTDSGSSWARAPVTAPNVDCANNMDAHGLDYERERGRFWAATSCGIAYSDDSGANWSYLPPGTGYANQKAYAIIAPASGHLKILTDAGVRISEDGGLSWRVSDTGLPTYINKGVHNQIAVSPQNHRHLFWAFNYWVYDAAADSWSGRWGLYLSVDNGDSWSSLRDVAGINRPPFVRVANALSERTNRYDVYLGSGGCWISRAEATHGATPILGAWTTLTVDHCDASDIVFSRDGRTPILMTSDGGLHKTADNGLNWTFTGGNGGGYNALQITEVTGQLNRLRSGSDLYFATQDNDIWASSDAGRTWAGRICCEGFFLRIPREYHPPETTRLTGVTCGACGNFISRPMLRNVTGFPNPPNDAGNPVLLKVANYIQRTSLPGVDASLFSLTDDTGASWTPRFGFPETAKSFPAVAGPRDDRVVYMAVKRPGVTPTGEEILEIKKITGVMGTGTPVVSDVTGFGSLGTFPTMFAWYKPYGVSEHDPNHLIVPDIVDEKMKITTDGGSVWNAADALTSLITHSGEFRFRWNSFVQVSNIAFDPSCRRHVLIGTREAGIFRSVDAGRTWRRIANSERVPRVSSFYFTDQNSAIISTYGRGLWKLNYRCEPPPFLLPWTRGVYRYPVLYIDGVLTPLRNIDRRACVKCDFFLSRRGSIKDYQLDKKTGKLASVALDKGEIIGIGSSGERRKPPFKIAKQRAKLKPHADPELRRLRKAGNEIKGMYLEEGKLVGLVLAKNDVSEKQLPSPKAIGPRIVVALPTTHGAPLRELKQIRVTGYGFDPRFPLEIYLDDRQVKFQTRPKFDEKGDFHFVIPPAMDVGGHTIRVVQKTDNRVIQDVYTFNVTVQDLPLNKDPDRHKKRLQKLKTPPKK